MNVESLQDTSTYHTKDQSIGDSVTVGYGFSGSANFSQYGMRFQSYLRLQNERSKICRVYSVRFLPIAWLWYWWFLDEW
ncbi:hypothetical protein [Ralstonia solanacearum]|uniref:hypothetical protein n=1 Tax=Ralstonia solanacearum TaxID=305 RepID=UPI0012D36967|nr:hypothetical protein [Ralstonia solanacearum]